MSARAFLACLRLDSEGITSMIGAMLLGALLLGATPAVAAVGMCPDDPEHPENDVEVVKPKDRDPVRWVNARCNDGTPFGFYIRRGSNPNKWVFYLEGGKFCDGPSSDTDDYALSCPARFSNDHAHVTEPEGNDGECLSRNWQGILSKNAAVNPDFATATIVVPQYCSSDYWSGSMTDPRPVYGSPIDWYFSGRANIAAMLEVLTDENGPYGLDDDPTTHPNLQVLWAGGSAGAFGAQITAEQVAEKLPHARQAGRLRLFIDAGWMTDWPVANIPFRMGASGQDDRDTYRDALEFWGATLDAECGQPPVDDEVDCILGPGWYDRLVNADPPWKILVQDSATDQAYLLLHHILPGPYPQAKDAWAGEITESMALVEWLYSTSDPTHTMANNNAEWMGQAHPHGDCPALRKVVHDFVTDQPAQQWKIGGYWGGHPCEIPELAARR